MRFLALLFTVDVAIYFVLCFIFVLYVYFLMILQFVHARFILSPETFYTRRRG